KKSLTGDNSERVDTRALQVLYALPDQRPAKVYVGQQMEVFLALGEDNKYLADTQPAFARPAVVEHVPAANSHGSTTTTADQPR
ncbi:MAG TPA: hypothetical protein VJY33_22700, partial [Isosphaeraceae bacterium]|nr:hypothetical protein [Isosphaeraceae bacterium]